MPTPELLVEMRDVSKSFGAARVLDRVSLSVRPGEVHVLAGENGAGKSTLIKILSGAIADFEGSLAVAGRLVRFRSPRDARDAGIATIHQELSLVGPMSVADNLFLGRETTGAAGLFDRRRQRRRAEELLRRLGLDVDPDGAVEDLPIATQQLLEIARALGEEARAVVMDEPTSALNDGEAELLFAAVRRLTNEGRGVIYISHRMEEIYALGDRITVLRDGGVVGTATPAELPRGELVRWMIGREGIGVPDPAPDPVPVPVPEEREALRLTGIRVLDDNDRLDVDGVSLTVRRGEIVGIAGLRGSGCSELLHGIFGALGRRASGSVLVDGRPAPIEGPRASIARGLVLLASDRRRAGIVPDLGVAENATLSSLDRFSWHGVLRRRAEREAAARIARRFKLSARPGMPAGALSGGGQQKVYLGRCLLAEPRVLLLDEPTRGVDVGAKADIHEALRELAADGIAVVLVTSELEELLALCHRIVVLHRGKVSAELDGRAATREAVLEAAMGRRAEAA
jgi:ABC-type sugar transport system ATPase subunit